MKSTTETPADAVAVQLKCALALALAKEDHTLSELEDALAARDTEKTANLLKVGAPLDMLKTLYELGTGVAMLGAGSAALTGGIGAAGIYGGYKGLQDTKKKIDDAAAVRQRIDIARRELEHADLGGR